MRLRGSRTAPFGAAAALFAGAAVVAGAALTRAPLLRGGAAMVAAAFATRAVMGVTGATVLVAPGATTTDRFRRLDRVAYAPLCASIALATLPDPLRACAP